MQYKRMPIEIESPESLGYDSIACNLAESSVRDLSFRDLGIDLQELILAYGDHMGKPALRELVAASHRNLEAADVLITAGAAAALFMVHTAFLRPQDHLVVLRPNYATNIETPRAIGCQISFIDLLFEEGFTVSVEKIKKAIRPNTRMISVTTPHNPTGTEIGEYAMGELCRLAELHGIVLLVDETYRDLGFHEPSTLAASLSGQAISICSMSKAYGIPGIRLGWLMTQNKYWQEVLLAAKEQICICNSVVDEEIGYQFLLGKDPFIAGIGKQTQENFRQLCDWMDHHAYLEWVKPTGGVVCFPRFREGTLPDAERFYHVLLNQYQTYVGPGHWFEQEMRYFRLGFGWEKKEAFMAGLENIDRAIRDCRG